MCYLPGGNLGHSSRICGEEYSMSVTYFRTYVNRFGVTLTFLFRCPELKTDKISNSGKLLGLSRRCPSKNLAYIGRNSLQERATSLLNGAYNTVRSP